MTAQKTHIEFIYHIAFLFTAIGVSSDNLMIAGISRNKATVLPASKSYVVGALLFLIQITMLYWAKIISGFAPTFMSGRKEWMALFLLYFIAANSIRERRSANNRRAEQIKYTAPNVILLATATASYILAFGLALNWLNRMDNPLNISLRFLIALFLAAGVFLGNKQNDQWLKIIHNVSIVLLVLGVALLLLLTFN